jgi:L-glyceraldehyde 3-phosphate reductase
MGLDYVDIFYSHRPDPETPLEETMGALASAVKQGKALYAAISNYSAEQTREASGILRDLGVPLLIHQPRYSMLDRWVEADLLTVLEQEGVGCIPFSPLAQGLLSDKYLKAIPENSRMKNSRFLKESALTEGRLKQLHALNDLAKNREQSLAQMALAWVLRHSTVTSVLIGASSSEQIRENVASINALQFNNDELSTIEKVLSQA